LAHLLAPIVDRIHWWIPPSGSRAPAIAVVYLLLLGVVVALAIVVGSKIVEEGTTLAGRLPSAIPTDPLASLPLPKWLESSRADVDQVIRTRIQQLDQDVVPMLTSAGEQVVTGIGNIFRLILIPILSFFALKDGVRIRRALVGAVRPGSRDLLEDILNDLHLLLLSYIRALLTLAIATFVSHVTVLSLMGVPYPVLLAGIAASLEVIPVIGPLTGAIIILLVAIFSGYPHLIWLALFFIVYRIFQDYVLSPFLMSSEIELHPMLVLLGVLAGEQVAGVQGMFFSVPVLAALRVIYVRVRKHHDETPAPQP
jgi:predicted PurR-regulated permease PerM